MLEKVPTQTTSDKYSSFEGWYENEQKRWALTDEQLEVRRKRRLANIADQLTSLSAAPIRSNLETPLDTTSDLVSRENEQTHEENSSLFLAQTFEDAHQLSNPVPENVIDKLIESQGEVNLYKFVSPDKSDLALTKEQKEDYFYNGIKDLRRDFARTVDGRSTLTPQFVFAQYDTPTYAKRRAAGEKIQVTDRIYLNPKQLDRLEIYREFLSKAEQHGLSVRSKIYESISESVGGLGGLRQDAIVIYATPENRNETLELIQNIYKDHEKSFEGRTSTPQTCELAPGLAVGSEPIKFTGTESLTSIREKILNGTYKNVMKTFNEKGINPTPEQIKRNIRKFAHIYMQKNNIDTHNWSFDLDQ